MFSSMLSELKSEGDRMSSSLLQLPICLRILIYLKFFFLSIFISLWEFIIVCVLIFIYLKHHTIYLISNLSIRLFYHITFVWFFMITVFWWYWGWSTLNFLRIATIVFLLLNRGLLYCRSFIMFINCCPYSHCCPTGNNGDAVSTAVLPVYLNPCVGTPWSITVLCYTPFHQHGSADVMLKYFPFRDLLL
jgi:hypothetical protein